MKKINVYYKNGKRISIPQEKPWFMHQNDFNIEVIERAREIKQKPSESLIYGLKFELIRSVTITG